MIRCWRRYPVEAMTLLLLERAPDAKRRWNLSCRDAAIIEAARKAACYEVLSGDLSHGQDYAGVMVVNPFR